jgi:predicted nuclease with TOPRIM domain
MQERLKQLYENQIEISDELRRNLTITNANLERARERMNTVKSELPEDLKLLVEKYYPNYYQSTTITHYDDLWKVLEGQIDSPEMEAFEKDLQKKAEKTGWSKENFSSFVQLEITSMYAEILEEVVLEISRRVKRIF